MFEAALEGLAGVLQPEAFMFMTLGVLIGSLVGFLPGIGGPSTLAIMLPFVMTMTDPLLVIALLVGMDAVGNTASAFTSILISVPGSSGSQATILDGHPMAKNGEGARALSASFVASLLGGIFGALVLFASLPILKPLVLSFSSPEFFILTLWGVSMVGILSGNAPLKACSPVFSACSFQPSVSTPSPASSVSLLTFHISGKASIWSWSRSGSSPSRK